MPDEPKITLKDFYELQLKMDRAISDLGKQVALVSSKLTNQIEQSQKAGARYDSRFEQHGEDLKEIREDLEKHKLVDQWFKGITASIQALIVTAQAYLFTRK